MGISTYVPENRGDSKPGSPYFPDTFYVIPKSLRSLSADTDLILRCDSFQICQIPEISGDGKVAFTYAFQAKVFPEPTWTKLDETLRRLAAYIFIDRTPGDFQ